MGMSKAQAVYNAVCSDDLNELLELIERDDCDEDDKDDGDDDDEEDWLAESCWIGQALEIAAERGELEILDALLRNGADASSRGAEDYPIIFSACNNEDVIYMLCSYGADVNSVGVRGESLLEQELDNGRYDSYSYMSACTLHLEHSAQLTAGCLAILRQPAMVNGMRAWGVSEEQKDFLQHCKGFPEMELYRAAGRGEVRAVQTIIASASRDPYMHLEPGLENINHLFDYTYSEDEEPCWKGEEKAEPFGTALMQASYAGQLAVVELLLANGADPNVASSRGETALQWAVQGGHFAITVLLIQAKADVDVQSERYGFTALMEVAVYDSPLSHLGQFSLRTHIAELLLQANCDIYLEDDEGQTALQMTVNPHVAALLVAEPKRRRDVAWGRRGWLACLRERATAAYKADILARLAREAKEGHGSGYGGSGGGGGGGGRRYSKRLMAKRSGKRSTEIEESRA